MWNDERYVTVQIFVGYFLNPGQEHVRAQARDSIQNYLDSLQTEGFERPEDNFHGLLDSGIYFLFPNGEKAREVLDKLDAIEGVKVQLGNDSGLSWSGQRKDPEFLPKSGLRLSFY